MVLHWLTFVSWICVFISGCVGLCTLPSAVQGTWDSSDKGQLNITAMAISGYSVHDFGSFNFACEMQDGDKYIVKSEQFQRYNLPFNVYMCIIFTQVTRVSSGELYTYYLAANELADAGNERVHIWHNSRTLTASSDICTISNFAGVPYSMLMLNGSIDNVVTTCPIPFLGNFAYEFDTGSGNLCNDSGVEVCNTKTTMNWNYTACSQIQAYSTGGVTKCVHFSFDNTTGTDVYTLHVYNTDATTDQSTTYGFTCYVITGYDIVYATQAPGDCQTGQNYTHVASPGATLVLNSSAVCAYPASTTVTPEAPDDTVLSAGVVAAIVIICLLLLILLVLGLIYYFYKSNKRRKNEEYAAANRKIDPDELSPNMRLGLPDESRYDLDRLMFSPEHKNGHIKKEKGGKNIIGLDTIEGFNEAGMYMDEAQRQTALEAHMYTEKRKRKDNKDEFQGAERKNKQFSARIKEMSKGRKRPIKASALAKLRIRPRPKPMRDEPDAHTYSGAKAKDIVIQVEEAEIENKRKTRFADELQQSELEGGQHEHKGKPLEEVETLSDIADNEMAVADLSDDDIGPRLKLPSLRPEKKHKSKRAKDRFSLGSNLPISDSMPRNTRFMPPKPKQKQLEEYLEPPIIPSKPNTAKFSFMARIHRKDKDLKKAMEDTGTEECDLETLKSRMSDIRWRRLLEELYADKKYFDYVKKSNTKSENDLLSISKEGLQYLYGRAMFWEQQQPIPARPPSHLRRLFSRQEQVKPKSAHGLVRSSTTRSSYKRMARTPSTQVSRLKSRDKKSKEEENAKVKMNDANVSNGVIPDYFEGSTQTDFSPLPLSPMTAHSPDSAFLEDTDTDKGSLPGVIETDDENTEEPMSFAREVTKSDIKLEGFDKDFGVEKINHRLLIPSPIRRDVTKTDIILEECDGDYNHETIGKDFSMAV